MNTGYVAISFHRKNNGTQQNYLSNKIFHAVYSIRFVQVSALSVHFLSISLS